jgi:hypothetical protein
VVIPARSGKLWIILAVAFLFRLGFGLSTPFWSYDDDQRQIYLIGLKFYSTGQWPYFGPDVNYPSNIQIPGGLQGVLAGLPLYLCPLPEAPFVLVNILSFSSLCLLAWYSAKRLPGTPTWFIWAWLLTAPWTLNFSANVHNLSYLLPGAILFFVGFLEVCPFTSLNLISYRSAGFMMGFGLLWVMQLHLSWPILVPYVLGAFYYQYQISARQIASSIFWFVLGAALPGSLLVPTLLKYGLKDGLGGTNAAAQFNLDNLLQAYNLPEGILGRFLSLASFEIPRFMGNHTPARLGVITREPWLGPFAGFLLLVGILQAIAMFVMWFSRNRSQLDWGAIKYLTLVTVCLFYVSFVFAFSGPNAHKLYVALPIAMTYGFYCWSKYLENSRWRVFAMICLTCGIVFHIGLGVDNLSRSSLYANREAVKRAISERDYRIAGERREGSRY